MKRATRPAHCPIAPGRQCVACEDNAREDRRDLRLIAGTALFLLFLALCAWAVTS